MWVFFVKEIAVTLWYSADGWASRSNSAFLTPVTLTGWLDSWTNQGTLPLHIVSGHPCLISPGRSSDLLHNSSDTKRSKQELPIPSKERVRNGTASLFLSQLVKEVTGQSKINEKENRPCPSMGTMWKNLQSLIYHWCICLFVTNVLLCDLQARGDNLF